MLNVENRNDSDQAALIQNNTLHGFRPARDASTIGLLRRLGVGTLSYGLARFGSPLIGFLLLPILTNFLSPTDYGILDLVNTTLAIMVVIMRFGTLGSISVYYFELGEGRELQTFVSTVAVFVIAWGLTIGLAVGLAAVIWGEIFLPEGFLTSYFLIAVLGAFLELLPEAMRRLLQARENARLFGILTFFRSASQILFTVFLVAVLLWGLEGAIVSRVVVAFLYLGVALYFIREDLALRFSRKYLRAALAYGLPTVPHNLSSWFLAYASRFILVGSSSLVSVGLFSVGTKIASVVMIVGSAFGLAWQPLYFDTRKRLPVEEARHRLGAIATVSVIGFLFILTVLISFASPAIKLMTSPEFHEAVPITMLSGVAYFVGSLGFLFVNSYYYDKKTYWAPIISFSAGATNIVVAFLLIPRYDALGAAAGLLAGYAVSTFLAYIVDRHYFKVSLNWTRIFKAGALTMLVFVFNVRVQIGNTWLELLLAAGLCVLYALGLVVLGCIKPSEIKGLKNGLARRQQ